MPDNPSRPDPPRHDRPGIDPIPVEKDATRRSSPRAGGGSPDPGGGIDGPGRFLDSNGRSRSQPRGTGAGVESAGEEIDPGSVIETVFSPFHCLYQDALYFHTQCRLARSDGEAGRLARAALLLYVSSAEALVHQAAAELGRAELRGLIADPSRPLPTAEAWRLLPAIAAEPGTPTGAFDPESPPWPQFAELVMLRTSWGYPGPAPERRAFYRSARRDGDYEPLQPHQVPPGLRRSLPLDRLAFPRTGLPRDPYALRPRHLDTVRGILDDAIEALDRRMGGSLTRGHRHRREPVRVVHPPAAAQDPPADRNASPPVPGL